jgi:hypothetical protein
MVKWGVYARWSKPSPWPYCPRSFIAKAEIYRLYPELEYTPDTGKVNQGCPRGIAYYID